VKLFSTTGQEHKYVAWWLEKQKVRQNITLRFNKLGLDVNVRKTVFSPDPAETHSSSLFLKHLPKLAGKDFLDMGGGCGVLSLLSASQQAAKTVVVDNDEEAIGNIRENLERHNVLDRAIVSQGDLFENLDGTFDVIAANLPIVDSAWPQIEEGAHNLHSRFVHEDVSQTCLQSLHRHLWSRRFFPSFLIEKHPHSGQFFSWP